MTIVFEAYTGTTTAAGDGSGQLPLLRSFASDALVTAGGSGRLQLLGLALGGTSARGALPLLVGWAQAGAGPAGRGKLPALAGFGTATAPQPSVAVQVAPLPPIDALASGHATGYGDQNASLPLIRSLGSDTAAVALASLPLLRARAFQIAPPQNLLFALASPGVLLMQGAGTPGRRLVESLELGAVADIEWAMVRRSLLALADASSPGLLEAIDQIGDRIAFHEVAGITWSVLCAEAASFGTSVALSTSMLVEAASTLALAAGHGSVLDALEAVVESVRLGDAAGYAFAAAILESISLGTSEASGLLALEAANERMSLSSQAVGAAGFTVLASDAVALSDGGSSTALLLDQIREGVAVLARFNLPDGQYLAWVCNTESRAFHTYRNFPFNSFCELDGHYYGATDAGIYLLEGDDDDGTPIDALVRTGLMDLGTGLLKRMEAMYLGYRSDGQLLLKVITTSDRGEKTESWYSLDPQPADAMREGRIKVGKGLKSLYWGFELANVDGSDFEIDTLSMLPMILERRI